MTKTLVLATHNEGKLEEIRSLVTPYAFRLLGARDLNLEEPEETGESFIDNALLKARAAARASGFPALADDSGFSVEALNGQPGIFSARWGGPERDFKKAMKRVWEAVENSGRAERGAHFVCALALVLPSGEEKIAEGKAQGHIVWPPRGEKGFGYDPMFRPLNHIKTFGEMSPEEKNPLSHRTKAFDSMKRILKNLET